MGVVRISEAASKSEAYEAPATESPTTQADHPTAPAISAAQQHAGHIAIAIAPAAKKLNDLREWTYKVSEVIPLGLDHSPYPDRIEPKPDISEPDLKALQKRTLTNLYNLHPAWLSMAHQQLDLAVAAAYGWANYSAAWPDEKILKRLLALNPARDCVTDL